MIILLLTEMEIELHVKMYNMNTCIKTSHRIKIYDMHVCLLTEMEIELYIKMYNMYKTSHRIKIYDMHICLLTEMEIGLYVKMNNVKLLKDIQHEYINFHRNENRVRV